MYVYFTVYIRNPWNQRKLENGIKFVRSKPYDQKSVIA